MSVVKTKSFPMPPINVDEAVMCLDYIDHDCEMEFLMFRLACFACLLCLVRYFRRGVAMADRVGRRGSS